MIRLCFFCPINESKVRHLFGVFNAALRPGNGRRRRRRPAGRAVTSVAGVDTRKKKGAGFDFFSRPFKGRCS